MARRRGRNEANAWVGQRLDDTHGFLGVLADLRCLFGRRLQFSDDIRYVLDEPEFEIERINHGEVIGGGRR